MENKKVSSVKNNKNINNKNQKKDKNEKKLIITKKILVSLLIILLSNFIIYFFPLLNCARYNTWYSNNKASFSESELNVMNSNADQSIKDKASNIVKLNSEMKNQKDVNTFSILTYIFALYTLLMLVSALVIFKNCKDKKTDKKYIAIALLISAIVSAIICILYAVYGHYYYLV